MIKRARRDGREARVNDEREKRELRKGAERRLQKKKKETIRQFEEEGLRDPPFIEFSRSDPSIVSSSPQDMTSWSSSIKI